MIIVNGQLSSTSEGEEDRLKMEDSVQTIPRLATDLSMKTHARKTASILTANTSKNTSKNKVKVEHNVDSDEADG